MRPEQLASSGARRQCWDCFRLLAREGCFQAGEELLGHGLDQLLAGAVAAGEGSAVRDAGIQTGSVGRVLRLCREQELVRVAIRIAVRVIGHHSGLRGALESVGLVDRLGRGRLAGAMAAGEGPAARHAVVQARLVVDGEGVRAGVFFAGCRAGVRASMSDGLFEQDCGEQPVTLRLYSIFSETTLI